MFTHLKLLSDKLDHIGAIVLLALMILIPTYFLLARKLGYKYRKQLFGTRKITGQSTDIPLGGNLLPAVFIICNQERVFPGDGKLVKAYFIRWIMEGRIQVLDSVPGQPYTVYLFDPENTPEGEYEKAAFKELRKIAGKDLMLTRYKCYMWGKKEHQESINQDLHMTIWFEEHNYVEKRKPLNLILNADGAAAARKVVELEHYLSALIDGTATVSPDPEKIAYYVQFTVLWGKWEQFKEILPKYPSALASLAQTLKCSPDKVIEVIDTALLTLYSIEEGADYASD